MPELFFSSFSFLENWGLTQIFTYKQLRCEGTNDVWKIAPKENYPWMIAPRKIATWMIAPRHLPQRQLPPDNTPLETAAEEDCLADDLLPT